MSKHYYQIATVQLALQDDTPAEAIRRLHDFLHGLKLDEKIFDWRAYPLDDEMVTVGPLDPANCDDEDIFMFRDYNLRANEKQQPSISFDEWKFDVMGAPDPEKRVFYCIYGAWQEGILAHEPSARILYKSDINSANGYNQEDIAAIMQLKIGESYSQPDNNHSIFRITPEMVDATSLIMKEYNQH